MPPRKRHVERWREVPRRTTRVPDRAPGGGIREVDFQDQIVELCKWAQLWSYHPYDSRRSTQGWPDLVIIGPAGILFRELKTETGKLSEDQKKVLTMLRAVDMNAAVWRPSDLALGNIQTELRDIGGKL